MVELRETEQFSEWLLGLRDRRGAAIIARRVKRLESGNFGDAEPVGEGITELRIHFGPGYRVYVTQRGAAIVVLLCGGDKSSQSGDIAQAKRLAKDLDV